jgi:hypothetical protein
MNNDEILNLEIKQGADFLAQMELVNEDDSPINLTGFTFAGQARKSYDSNEIEFSFSFQIINAANGILNVSLPNTFYQKKMTNVSKFVYDFEMNTGSKIVPIARGVINLIPEVTK